MSASFPQTVTKCFKTLQQSVFSSWVNSDSMWRSSVFNTLLESSVGRKVALWIMDPPFRTHGRNFHRFPLRTPRSHPRAPSPEHWWGRASLLHGAAPLPGQPEPPGPTSLGGKGGAGTCLRGQSRHTESLFRALLLEPAVPSQNPLLSLLGPFFHLLTIKANIKTFIRPLEPASPEILVFWQIQDALVCLYGLKAKRSRDYQEWGNTIRVSLTLFIKAHILSMLDFSCKASRILPQNVAIKQEIVKTNDISCGFPFWATVLHKVKFSLTSKGLAVIPAHTERGETRIRSINSTHEILSN